MLPVPVQDVIFKRMSDGAVVFHCTDEVYFGLNAEGARLWELLPPASRTFEELVARMAAEHPEVDAARIRSDAKSLIASLQELGLVASGTDAAT